MGRQRERVGRRKQRSNTTECTLCVGYSSSDPQRVKARHFRLASYATNDEGFLQVLGHLKGSTRDYAVAGDVLVLDGWVPLAALVVPEQSWHMDGAAAFAQSVSLLSAFLASGNPTIIADGRPAYVAAQTTNEP